MIYISRNIFINTVSFDISCEGYIIKIYLRGVAQLGSAPLWGSGGRGFKSRRSDYLFILII